MVRLGAEDGSAAVTDNPLADSLVQRIALAIYYASEGLSNAQIGEDGLTHIIGKVRFVKAGEAVVKFLRTVPSDTLAKALGTWTDDRSHTNENEGTSKNV